MAHRQTAHYNDKTNEVLLNVEAHKDYEQAAVLIQRKFCFKVNYFQF